MSNLNGLDTFTFAAIEGSALAAIVIVGGVLIALTSIIFNVIARTAASKEREQTRRELAAYVAEGSIRPEDAERILAAGEKGKHRHKGCCGAHAKPSAAASAASASV
ncbi:MAG: hypothetical protein HBSAPP03_19680 [Phycisphaerae bacterium]|nr:MAG: hypothetical protein HBSAPP03_19680 [Phycisphaerae bacterium]